jgi:two-component system LytT family sensor kinase
MDRSEKRNIRALSQAADDGGREGRITAVFSGLFDRVRKKDRFFWILNPAYWLFYLIFLGLAHASAAGWQPRIIFWCTLIAGIGFSAGFWMRWIYARVRIETVRPISVFMLMLAVTFLAANYWYGVDSFLDVFLKGPGDPAASVTWANYLTYLFYYELLLAGWSVLYFVLRFWFAFFHEQEKTARIGSLAHQSQIQMLRTQLNPHFLFNALNSLRALIDENGEHARDMVTELAEFLRYSLVTNNASDIPLAHELEALRHYFAIEKKRYEDKLEVEFFSDPEAEGYTVIPFLVHPLVENAVKYGMRTSRMPLRIRVSAVTEGDRLAIEVYNTGRWIVPGSGSGSGTGTGLSNVRQRLQTLFPGRHGFRIEPENEGVRIRIDLWAVRPARSALEAAG